MKTHCAGGCPSALVACYKPCCNPACYKSGRHEHGQQFIVQFRHPKFEGRVFRRELGSDKNLANVVCDELAEIANDPELAVLNDPASPDLSRFQQRTRDIWLDAKSPAGPFDALNAVSDVLAAVTLEGASPSVTEIIKKYARLTESLLLGFRPRRMAAHVRYRTGKSRRELS